MSLGIYNSCNAHEQTSRLATTTTERKRNSCIAQLRRDLCRSLHHTAGVVVRRQSMPDPKAPKTQNPKLKKTKEKKAKANASCAAPAPAAAATTMRRKTCFFDSNKYLPLHSRLLLLLLLLFLSVFLLLFSCANYKNNNKRHKARDSFHKAQKQPKKMHTKGVKVCLHDCTHTHRQHTHRQHTHTHSQHTHIQGLSVA